MKATIKFSSLEKSRKKLEEATNKFPNIAKDAVYEGAGVPADALRARIGSIPTDYQSHTWAKSGYQGGDKIEPVHGLTESQKQGLLGSLGISPFKVGIDTIDKKVGVDGYNDTVTKKYPKGQPNAMILRSIESGTSYHQKYPVIRPTVTSTRKQTKQVMEKTILEGINKITK